jgi:hypothetical protein
MTVNTHRNQTPVPPPPTDAERWAAWQHRQMTQPTSSSALDVRVLVILGIGAWVGAALAYMWAVGSIKIDNVFMSGDQSHAANYAPAIVLAVTGAFLMLIAAILGSRRP